MRRPHVRSTECEKEGEAMPRPYEEENRWMLSWSEKQIAAMLATGAWTEVDWP
jgi:hypothetical protein